MTDGATGAAGPLVLIVDDNERNLRLARDVLDYAGIPTIEARTAAAAIALAIERQPALVLMDIRLPDTDGPAALVTLRADPRTARIPVVAVTSSAMMGDRERLLAAGFDGYLEKPISVKEFAGQVRSYVRSSDAGEGG